MSVILHTFQLIFVFTAIPIDLDGSDEPISVVEEDMSIEFDKTLTNAMSSNADDIREKFGSFSTGQIPLTADCFNGNAHSQ